MYIYIYKGSSLNLNEILLRAIISALGESHSIMLIFLGDISYLINDTSWNHQFPRSLSHPPARLHVASPNRFSAPNGQTPQCGLEAARCKAGQARGDPSPHPLVSWECLTMVPVAGNPRSHLTGTLNRLVTKLLPGEERYLARLACLKVIEGLSSLVACRKGAGHSQAFSVNR